MNFIHGHDSCNTDLNPDAIMHRNKPIKDLILNHAVDIKFVLDQRIVGMGVTDLVCYLLDCALPHHEHLLPKGYQEKAYEYYYHGAFKSIRRYCKDKTLEDLLRVYNARW